MDIADLAGTVDVVADIEGYYLGTGGALTVGFLHTTSNLVTVGRAAAVHRRPPVGAAGQHTVLPRVVPGDPVAILTLAVIALMSTAEGIGATVGGLGTAWVVGKLTARRTTWLATVVAGLLVVVYFRMTDFPTALGVIFLATGLLILAAGGYAAISLPPEPTRAPGI
jgi:hypothetical protein